MLKVYYKVDKDGNPIDGSDNTSKQGSSPSPSGGNGKGAEAEYEKDELKLGAEIAKYLKQIKSKEVQHAS